MIKQVISILSLFFTIITVSAQVDSLTFEACINIALEQNLDVKIYDNNVRKEKLNSTASKLSLLPSIDGSASSSFNFNRSTNQNNEISSGTTYNVGYGVGSSITLFSGFRKINSILAQNYLQKISFEDFRRIKIDLYIDVVNRFAEILFLEEQLEATKLKVAISTKEVARFKLLIEQGIKETVALYEIEAMLSSNQLLLTREKNQLDLKKLELAHLIDYPKPELFEIKASSFGLRKPVIGSYKPNDIYLKAQDNFPELKAKIYQYAYAKKVLQLSRGNYWPSLSLSGGYSSHYFSTDTLKTGKKTPFDTQFNNYLNPYLGLSLRIPIFSGASRRISVKKSKINLENRSYELQKEEKSVQEAIETVVKKAENSLTEYLQAKDHLAFSRKSFDVYLEKYRLGIITTTDFITAQQQLSAAEASLLNAKYNWIIQDELIKIYSGEVLASPQQ